MRAYSLARRAPWRRCWPKPCRAGPGNGASIACGPRGAGHWRGHVRPAREVKPAEPATHLRLCCLSVCIFTRVAHAVHAQSRRGGDHQVRAARGRIREGARHRQPPPPRALCQPCKDGMLDARGRRQLSIYTVHDARSPASGGQSGAEGPTRGSSLPIRQSSRRAAGAMPAGWSCIHTHACARRAAGVAPITVSSVGASQRDSERQSLLSRRPSFGKRRALRLHQALEDVARLGPISRR